MGEGFPPQGSIRARNFICGHGRYGEFSRKTRSRAPGGPGGSQGGPGGPQGVILLDGSRAEFRAPEGEIGREYHPCEALGELYLSRGVPGVVLFSTPF